MAIPVGRVLCQSGLVDTQDAGNWWLGFIMNLTPASATLIYNILRLGAMRVALSLKTEVFETECLNRCSILGGSRCKNQCFWLRFAYFDENPRKMMEMLNQSWCHQILGYSTQKDHQYNVTGWVSMWAYDMLSQWGSTIKRALSPTATNRHLIS